MHARKTPFSILGSVGDEFDGVSLATGASPTIFDNQTSLTLTEAVCFE